jgi:hypothetical protein
MNFTVRAILSGSIGCVGLVAMFLVDALADPTNGSPIAHTAIESFEQLRPGGSIVTQQGVYMWVKGPIAFSSGVTLTGPFPQPAGDRGLVVCDFSFHPAAAFSLGQAFGTISTAADVPDGSAFLAFSDEDEVRPFEFVFDSEMRNVGAFVTGPPNASATMTAYDSMGSILATSSIQARPVSSWDDNFVSVTAAGIKRITIGGRVIVLDGLTFTSIPEPHVVALLVPALVMLFHRNRIRLYA